MRVRIKWAMVPTALLVVVSGCTSNLVVKKVPLEQRLCNADGCIDGFRYYTSRPYFVVDEPVEASRFVQHGAILKKVHKEVAEPNSELLVYSFAEAGSPEYIIRVLSDTASSSIEDGNYLDLAGNPIAVNPSCYGPLLDSDAAVFGARLSRLGAMDSAKSGETAGDGSGDAEATKGSAKPASVDKIRVVYLPDFEEQLAIKHCGQFSTNKFALRFVDGWQLGAVSAQVNNTQIPVAALQVLQGLIGGAKPSSSNTTATTQSSSSNSQGKDNSQFAPNVETRRPVYVQIVRRAILEPGMYRLNRTTEMDIAAQQSAIGLLTHLGIPLTQEVQIELVDKLMGTSLQDRIKSLQAQLDQCQAAKPKPTTTPSTSPESAPSAPHENLGDTSAQQ